MKVGRLVRISEIFYALNKVWAESESQLMEVEVIG